MVRRQSKGLTLVELLITVAVFVTIFIGLFNAVLYTSKLVLNSSMKLAALSLANERMEFFRSLPYDSVGTIAGIPPGTIPQNSTISLNGTIFSERVLVEYFDDPADGLNTSDSNGIPSDYKRIKVEVSWNVNSSVNGSIFLVSNIVPRSIETTVGGGTVRVNVIDANSLPLPGASVRLINTSTAPPIDITRFSDASGTALISGAPAAGSYEVIVTGPGFSTDQTYAPSPANPIPITAPFAVAESGISTLTFQIDRVSPIFIRTLASLTEASVNEQFNDMSGVADSTDVVVSGGALELATVGADYVPFGIVFLAPIVPPSVIGWKSIVVVAPTVPNTSYRVQLYTGTPGSYVLINEASLPGNGAGFTNSIIDISSLDPSAYPSMTVALLLDSSLTTATPQIDDVAVYYRESETVLANANLNVTGNRQIGTELDTTPIPKVNETFITNGAGAATLPNIEFDTYRFTSLDGYAPAHACSNVPLIHQAGATSTVELVLQTASANTLRVRVVDQTNTPLPGAAVSLSRSGIALSEASNSCGQVFFNSALPSASDYVLEATRLGYDTITITDYSILGTSTFAITLTEQ